jgi:hypothetical protein
VTQIEMSNSGFSIRGKGFCLEYDKRHPLFMNIRAEKLCQTMLVASTCDLPDRLECCHSLTTPKVVREGNDGCELRFSSKSNLWQEKTYSIRCGQDYIEYWFSVRGHGAIDLVRYFNVIEARRIASSDSKRRWLSPEEKDKRHQEIRTAAKAQFRWLFNPEPNADCYQLFRPDEFSVVTVNHHADYHHGNFYFTPGLLAFAAASTEQREWISVGIAPGLGQYNFNDFEYPGDECFSFALRYFGNVEVKGEFEFPHVVFHFGDSKEQALKKYVSWLNEHGYVELKPRRIPEWWRGPLVCGWGEQCYQADFPNVLGTKDRPEEKHPIHYANQGNYEEYVQQLERRAPDYKALIVDDKWQRSRGLPEADRGKWHDLRGFIDMMHRKGKRVILWWGLLTGEDVPDEECVMCGEKKVCEDITNPHFERKVRRAVREMISGARGCLDADGFKIDFTAGVPRGYGLKFYGKERGIEFLRKYFEIISTEAKRVKNDAMIIGHAANPYFAPVIDALRLNDMFASEENLCERMMLRREMAALANPHWLIDMDNWPCPTKKAWLDYIKIQPKCGIPSLYYVTHIDSTREPITGRDWAVVRRLWRAYLRRRVQKLL